MSTHDIYLYGEIRKVIELASNTPQKPSVKGPVTAVAMTNIIIQFFTQENPRSDCIEVLSLLLGYIRRSIFKAYLL